MEKIILFFCDIYGTFYSELDLSIDYNQFIRFINNLDNLKKVNGSDKLFFSFVTT